MSHSFWGRLRIHPPSLPFKADEHDFSNLWWWKLNLLLVWAMCVIHARHELWRVYLVPDGMDDVVCRSCSLDGLEDYSRVEIIITHRDFAQSWLPGDSVVAWYGVLMSILCHLFSGLWKAFIKILWAKYPPRAALKTSQFVPTVSTSSNYSSPVST